MKSVWRISNRTELSGLGGEKSDGHWHTAVPVKRIVYFSEHPAVCLIEALVNLKGSSRLFPDTYQLLKVNITDNVSEETLALDLLAENWRENLNETRSLGDSWLAKHKSALLVVPSAPSPESQNYIFNPLHPDAKGVSVAGHKLMTYDQRLFRVHGPNT